MKSTERKNEIAMQRGDFLKIRINGRTYEGTGEGIMDQLRLAAFDPTEYPDAQSYLQQLRANFIRTTGLDCPLTDGSVERQAQAMIEQLARYGALEVIRDG